ncbi:MAG: EAL domain-containing protein [Pseudomonadota bacterium]
MMARPKNVADAIEVGQEGCPQGRYKSFVLKPAYQPIFSVDTFGTWKISGFEGLVRPFQNGEQIETAEFFAEVSDEDQLFIQCMCMALHIRGYKNVLPKERTLFVNVDVSMFPSIDILETEIFYTFSQLPKNGLNRDRIVFEILETEVLEQEVLLRLCEMFRNNGFRFALDDFGTKHSNIERFLLVRPDIVKLDRAIFHNFIRIKETEKLLRALITAFRNNGSSVLMEGLENAQEVGMAADMNVDMMQGFALAKPELLPNAFEDNMEIPKVEPKASLHLVEETGLNQAQAR